MHKTRHLGLVTAAVLAAMTFQTVATAMSNPAPRKPAAATTARRSTKPAARAAVVKQPITISITSRIRRGSLVVLLDDVQVFNEKFEKQGFAIAQTTTWDPLQVTAGKHMLTAAVQGANGKTYRSGLYELDVSRTKGIELRIKMKGTTLTIEPAS